MSVQTTKIQAGDTLVNDDGTVTIQVNEIEDGVADVTDSRDLVGADEYERDTLEKAVSENELRIVRDSQLTEIKGIGNATGPEIEAKTGCETPSELVDAYFTEQESGVRDAVRRIDYLNEWILENYQELSVDVSLAEVKVMLFLTEFGCSPRSSSIRNVGEITTKYYNTIKEEKLTTDYLEWGDDSFWVSSASEAAVARTMDGLQELYEEDFWESYERCDTYDSGDGEHRFEVGGAETLVSSDIVERMREIFTFDLSDVNVDPDGECPVCVEDEETGLMLVMVPMVQ